MKVTMMKKIHQEKTQETINVHANRDHSPYCEQTERKPTN